MIDIEMKDRNKIKEIVSKLHSKLEDLMFFIIQRLPKKAIPHFLMEWLDRYLTKRLYELKQQTIKQTGRNIYLQEFLDNEIANREQNAKEAPAEE